MIYEGIDPGKFNKYIDFFSPAVGASDAHGGLSPTTAEPTLILQVWSIWKWIKSDVKEEDGKRSIFKDVEVITRFNPIENSFGNMEIFYDSYVLDNGVKYDVMSFYQMEEYGYWKFLLRSKNARS
tara:strand:+ start:1174 stop:1548 length:375 start_codon:yes stop_codon:yes gene_type:complete